MLRLMQRPILIFLMIVTVALPVTGKDKSDAIAVMNAEQKQILNYLTSLNNRMEINDLTSKLGKPKKTSMRKGLADTFSWTLNLGGKETYITAREYSNRDTLMNVDFKCFSPFIYIILSYDKNGVKEETYI